MKYKIINLASKERNIIWKGNDFKQLTSFMKDFIDERIWNYKLRTFDVNKTIYVGERDWLIIQGDEKDIVRKVNNKEFYLLRPINKIIVRKITQDRIEIVDIQRYSDCLAIDQKERQKRKQHLLTFAYFNLVKNGWTRLNRKDSMIRNKKFALFLTDDELVQFKQTYNWFRSA